MQAKSLAFLLLSALTVCAQTNGNATKQAYLANFDDVAKKLVSLAEAMPAEKMAWKPAEGVRSAGAVYIHVAGANFMIPNAMGVKPPADVKLSRDMEQTMTDKQQIVDLLKKSMENARNAVSVAMDKPDAPVKLFGRDMTNAGAALLLISHVHEHLGQSIAYARSNNVTPPWSRGGGE